MIPDTISMRSAPHSVQYEAKGLKGEGKRTPNPMQETSNTFTGVGRVPAPQFVPEYDNLMQQIEEQGVDPEGPIDAQDEYDEMKSQASRAQR